MIYPIADSEWVSPIQVVPKKGGTIVVQNKEGEVIPTRVQSGWRVYIDYRKLNKVTKKDHISLAFYGSNVRKIGWYVTLLFSRRVFRLHSSPYSS